MAALNAFSDTFMKNAKKVLLIPAFLVTAIIIIKLGDKVPEDIKTALGFIGFAAFGIILSSLYGLGFVISDLESKGKKDSKNDS